MIFLSTYTPQLTIKINLIMVDNKISYIKYRRNLLGKAHLEKDPIYWNVPVDIMFTSNHRVNTAHTHVIDGRGWIVLVTIFFIISLKSEPTTSKHWRRIFLEWMFVYFWGMSTKISASRKCDKNYKVWICIGYTQTKDLHILGGKLLKYGKSFL